MSQISADSYHNFNDLGSVTSNQSLHAHDEFNYDGNDLLFAWELSSRFNHQISRGVIPPALIQQNGPTSRLDDYLQSLNSTAIPPPPVLSKGGSGAHYPHHQHHHLQQQQQQQAEYIFETGGLNDQTLYEHDGDFTTLKGGLIAPSSIPNKGKGGANDYYEFPKDRSNDPINTELMSEAFAKGCSTRDYYESIMNNANHSGDLKKIECPERPFHLMKTHINLKLNNIFEDPTVLNAPCSSSTATATDKESVNDGVCPPHPCDLCTALECQAKEEHRAVDPVESIIAMITCYLNTFSEYDFSFFPKLFLWKGKYLQGSLSCLINIHLYKENKKPSCNHYIIEANRISGDAKPFHDFFKEFKHLLTHSVHSGSEQPPSPSEFSEFTSFDENDGFNMNNSIGLGELRGSVSCTTLASPTFNHISKSAAASRRTSRNLTRTLSGGAFMPICSPPPSCHKPTASCTSLPGSISAMSSRADFSSCLGLNDNTSTATTSPFPVNEDYAKSIEPILNMTKCHYYEVKLEAAKMLCDISQQQQYSDYYNSCVTQDSQCIDSIFKAIENLILHNDGFLTVKEQGVVAFTSFIDSNYCSMNQKEIYNRMLKSSILYVLLQLVTNPVNYEATFYETAQMRRESARILSILASYDAKQLLQTLEAQQCNGYVLKKWFDQIDLIKDSRTKIYAVKIRDCLLTALQLK